MKKRLPWILVCLLSLILIFIGLLWIPPLGIGEYGDSPDGKYLVNADNCGELLKQNYLRVQVYSNSTGEKIWECKRYPQPGEQLSVFGNRDKHFIHWATDSKSVSVEISDKEQIEVKVP